MVYDASFRGAALAASFSVFIFGAVEPGQDIPLDFLNTKESLSKNWREYNYFSSEINTFSLNAEITSTVISPGDHLSKSFDEEMAGFWESLEDGSIFNNIGVEVWEAAKRIAAAKPDIANYI